MGKRGVRVQDAKEGEETVHRKVEIMQHVLGHPGVVTLKVVYEDAECWHLVMELCSRGRLVNKMREGPCSEHMAAGILKEIFELFENSIEAKETLVCKVLKCYYGDRGIACSSLVCPRK
ncbi:hypothetical protein LR48_Vigan01g264100 [Vigna angularis]|uniref:Serine-threonine/tyrosine-protein kinase catalytic domain-containing protein n=1 Tax=Phaseolus angularis TaxID=3914 RepID=A0A0L9TRB6_PHAAN|nr:hypothetical protein LR48_Vigan01g264100 [Vigna angularis]